MAIQEGRLDERFVREWAAQVAQAAGMGPVGPALAERVLARLAKGARSYGAGSYRRVPLEELVSEIAEEADDIAGWSVSATARIFDELEAGRLNGRADEALPHLVRASAMALLAWEEIALARDALAPEHR